MTLLSIMLVSKNGGGCSYGADGRRSSTPALAVLLTRQVFQLVKDFERRFGRQFVRVDGGQRLFGRRGIGFGGNMRSRPSRSEQGQLIEERRSVASLAV